MKIANLSGTIVPLDLDSFVAFPYRVRAKHVQDYQTLGGRSAEYFSVRPTRCQEFFSVHFELITDLSLNLQGKVLRGRRDVEGLDL